MLLALVPHLSPLRLGPMGMPVRARSDLAQVNALPNAPWKANVDSPLVKNFARKQYPLFSVSEAGPLEGMPRLSTCARD
jgi:hypothetical protein